MGRGQCAVNFRDPAGFGVETEFCDDPFTPAHPQPTSSMPRAGASERTITRVIGFPARSHAGPFLICFTD
jgi:hypothetical protein